MLSFILMVRLFLKDASTKTAVDAESRRKMVSSFVLFLFLDRPNSVQLFSVRHTLSEGVYCSKKCPNLCAVALCAFT